MAWWKKPKLEQPIKALTASAENIKINGIGWQTWRFSDQAWQAEGWRLYDIVPELRYVVGWLGNSMSRCRLYVADVKDNGDLGDEAGDPEVRALAGIPFGRGPAKAEAIRLLGINQSVPGECWIVAEDGGQREDRWYVVTSSQLRREGDTVVIVRPPRYGGGEFTFNGNRDIMVRVWTPHPRAIHEPDSMTRAALPVLREIEQLTKREFAELDSRLIGAGILPLPQSVDFPRGDDDPPGLEGFAKMLTRVAMTSIQDRSNASALVPITMSVPDELVDKIKLVSIWSDMSENLLPMKESAIKRLALGLDVPPEILTGMGDANHWGAWQVEESTIKVHVEPPLARTADALNTGFLRRTLENMGKDPDAYSYAFDTAPLAVRPNRASDALAFHEAYLISDEEARQAGAFGTETAPSAQEKVERLIRAAVTNSPTILSDPGVRDLLGISINVQPSQDRVPPGPNPQVQVPPNPREIPQRTNDTEAAASALPIVAKMAVRRALELAGGRLTSPKDRNGKDGRYNGVPRHQLHASVGGVERDKARQALSGAWDHIPELAAELAVDKNWLQQRLDGYCFELLTRGMAHHDDLLEAALKGPR